MADPIDDLERMIADALSAAEAMNALPEVKDKIQQWRQTFGGDAVYIARRAHIDRHRRMMELLDEGLTVREVSAKLGVTRQAVSKVRRKTSSYLWNPRLSCCRSSS